MYLIYSRKHSHGEVMWWRPESRGYTRDVNSAGRYTLEEVRAICTHPEDSVPIHIDRVLEALDLQLICDEGYGDNCKILAALVGVGIALVKGDAK